MIELEFDEELKVIWKDSEREQMTRAFDLNSNSMSDILEAEFYPSDVILARLANVVELQKTDSDYKDELPKDWVLLATGSSPKSIQKKKKYFGAAFVHHKARQVVVVHLETNEDSTKMISAHKVYINSATTFINFIREVVILSASYNLTITGHRYGGWLAQLTAFTVKYLSIEKYLDKNKKWVGGFKKDVCSKLHPKTVVFDSPGARDLLNTVLDVYYDRYRKNVLDGLNITVYVSTQNEINTCGLHLGKFYSVSNNNSDVNTKEGLKYFIDILEKNALETCEIRDWPKEQKEFSFNKKNCNKVPNDNQPKSLSKKSLRWAEHKCQSNNENISSHFKNFAEDELIMLYKLHIIQEQKPKVEIHIEDKKICFPSFKIDPYKRMILCESRKSLDELTNRLKQLMRYLEKQFSAAVNNQIEQIPQAADLIYRAEGQSYLGSSPRSTLDFVDSIGLKDFLSSETLQILQVDTEDGEFEMTRLQNIFFQIKKSKNLPPQIHKYTVDNHYTFLTWHRLRNLYIFGSPDNQNDLMIVDASSPKDKFKTISEEDVKPLINYLKSAMKKLVFILSKSTDNNIFNSIEKNLIITTEGNFNLKNLSEKSQNTLFKKKKLIFTGNKGYSFQEFMGENSSVDDLNEFLSSDCLKNIALNKDYVINLKGKRPTLDLPQMPLYKSNIKTSKEFILSYVNSSDTNILMVVSGLSHEELEAGSRPGWEQLAFSGKDTLHQSHEDAELSFYRMCHKNPDKSVYLLAVSGEDIYCKLIFNPGFYIPRTFYNLQSVDPSELIDEATLALSERSVVILADDPGTGKTTTLERLSRQLESKWVIYIRFKYFKTHIEKLPEELDAKNVACFLLSECTHADNGLDNSLLEYLLEKDVCSRRIVVMFAGFDELDDYKDKEKSFAKEKIIKLLLFLKNKPTVQIFLTARKYYKEFLELKLEQISTFFKGISEQQQVDVLVKFWLSRATLELRDNGEEEKRRLETLARKLLPEVKRVLSPDNDCFMGVPLHMQMLAEYFSPQSEWHADLINGPDLFKRYMNLRYDIYFHDKRPQSIADIHKHSVKDKLTKNHCKLGFKTFFPTFYNKHEDHEHFKPIEMQRLMSLNRYGLLQSKENGEFQFVYQASAEYFCAQWVVYWLKQRVTNFDPPLIKEILLPQILLLPAYKTIRWFMNALLSETQNSNALELITAYIRELCLESSASQENETPLKIAIREKNEHIVKLLRELSSESI